jgi:hypothetical protein
MKKKYTAPSIVDTVSEEELVEKAAATAAFISIS